MYWINTLTASAFLRTNACSKARPSPPGSCVLESSSCEWMTEGCRHLTASMIASEVFSQSERMASSTTISNDFSNSSCVE